MIKVGCEEFGEVLARYEVFKHFGKDRVGSQICLYSSIIRGFVTK